MNCGARQQTERKAISTTDEVKKIYNGRKDYYLWSNHFSTRILRILISRCFQSQFTMEPNLYSALFLPIVCSEVNATIAAYLLSSLAASLPIFLISMVPP